MKELRNKVKDLGKQKKQEERELQAQQREEKKKEKQEQKELQAQKRERIKKEKQEQRELQAQKKQEQKVFKVFKKLVKEVEKNKAKQKILRRKVFKELKAKVNPNPKRASVEYNFAEFVVPLLLDNISINTTEELFRIIDNFDETITKIRFNTEDDKKEYIKDIYKKYDLLEDYINNFRKIDSSFWRNIKYIYISGKKNKHKFIDELNKGYDVKETKSDIYIEYLDKPPIGLSLKQSFNARKSNYSCQKILNIFEDGLDKKLTGIKKTYVISHNFYGLKGLEGVEKKQQRKFANSLFYIKNPYFDALKFYIEKYKVEIGIKLCHYLNSTAVPYDVYEFDGNKMVHLNKNRNFKNIKFELHEPYKYQNNGDLRNAAKLFYQLTYEDKKYKVEVNFKGNIFTESTQFCIFND